MNRESQILAWRRDVEELVARADELGVRLARQPLDVHGTRVIASTRALGAQLSSVVEALIPLTGGDADLATDAIDALLRRYTERLYEHGHVFIEDALPTGRDSA